MSSRQRAAGVIPVPALTAAQVLSRTVLLKPGEILFANGGRGVTGEVFVAIGAQMGARVIATADPGSVERLRRYGAGAVLDYHHADARRRFAASLTAWRGQGGGHCRGCGRAKAGPRPAGRRAPLRVSGSRKSASTAAWQEQPKVEQLEPGDPSMRLGSGRVGMLCPVATGADSGQRQWRHGHRRMDNWNWVMDSRLVTRRAALRALAA